MRAKRIKTAGVMPYLDSSGYVIKVSYYLLLVTSEEGKVLAGHATKAVGLITSILVNDAFQDHLESSESAIFYLSSDPENHNSLLAIK